MRSPDNSLLTALTREPRTPIQVPCGSMRWSLALTATLARWRVAGDSADFKHAVCNFRYFIGVQFDEEIAGSTAQDDLFAAGVADFFDAQEEGADAVAAAEVFARNHLVARNQRVQFAGNDFDDDAVAFDAFDRTGHDVFFDGETRSDFARAPHRGCVAG